MRILHTADLHLGKTVNEFSMLEDQRFLLQQLLGVIEEKKVDAVVISGDIYDRSVPPEDAVSLLDGFLTALSQKGIPALLISGNHDSAERLSYGAALFAKSGIHIAGTFTGTLPCVTLEDAYGPVNFYLLPFVKASTVRYYFPDAEIAGYEDAVKTVIASADIDPAVRNVCLSHQFVTDGGADPALSGSESTGAKEVGTIERVGGSAYAPFDYTALGHIHGFQAMKEQTIVYSGSPLKYSLREIGQDKCFVLLDLKEKREGRTDLAIERIPVTPLHEMRHIKGDLKDLLNHAEDTGDYIYATLTDEEPILDAMSAIRSVYPNAMKLDYENRRTRLLAGEEVPGEVKERSFSQIAEDFAVQVTGEKLSEKEKALLRACAVEAGILEA